MTSGDAVRIAGASINVALALAYPIAVYAGLSRGSPRTAATVILVALLPLFLLRCLRSRRHEHFAAVVRSSLCVLGLVALSALLNDARFMLAIPVLVNAVWLAMFAVSLRGPMPLVERFARMHDRDLPAEKIAYCRSVTKVWCAFCLANGLMALALALLAPLRWWALYTGLIAYLLVGTLFFAEYAVRRYRFSPKLA